MRMQVGSSEPATTAAAPGGPAGAPGSTAVAGVAAGAGAAGGQHLMSLGMVSWHVLKKDKAILTYCICVSWENKKGTADVES